MGRSRERYEGIVTVRKRVVPGHGEGRPRLLEDCDPGFLKGIPGRADHRCAR